MNVEEAIYELERMKTWSKELSDEEIEAIVIALKALSRSKIPNTCGDTISRQAVDAAIYDYSRSCDVNYQQIMEYIEKIPSVSPQQRTGRQIGMTKEELINKIEKEEKWLIHALNDQTDVPYQYSVDIAFDAVKHYVKDCIKSQQRTGRWIEKDGYDGDVYYDCSVCGESWASIEGTPKTNGMKYCPNCGARMEVEE